MKLRSLGACLVLATQLMTTQTWAKEADKTFLDPRLEAWNQIPESSLGIADQTKTVIVFVKQPQFQDRSGMPLGIAKQSEKQFITDYVTEIANDALVGTQFAVKGKLDVLWSSQAFVTLVDRATLARLSANPNIEGIVENIVIQLEQPIASTNSVKTDESKQTYGLQKIKAQSAWDQGLTGKGVIVGVIDTGIDESHPDLEGKVILNKDFTKDGNTTDHHGHGTHVSGTIAGGSASGKSIGVAPEAQIMMAKVFDKKGGATMEGLLKAMEWFLDPDGDPNTNDSPRVVSNSWGSNSQFSYGFRNVIRSWRRFGIFPNFAAGNSGFFFSINAPGAYPFSYAIGAVDENQKVTSFSSRGPTIWWESKWYPQFIKKPDVSAPGLDVYSSMPGGKWQRMSGTSMATPHVAGVIALMLQANPDLTVEDMQEILDTTAKDLGSNGKDNRYGHGIVQVDQVVERAKSWQRTKYVSFFQDKDPNQWGWDTP